MGEGWCARSYVSDALLAARATAAYSPGGRGLAGGHRGSRARGRSTWNRREPMFSAWTYCIGLVGTVGTTALNSSCVGDTATRIRGLRLHGPRQHGIASNARQSPRAGAGSTHSRGEAWVWALGADADCGWPPLSAVSGRFRVRPGGVRRPWCAAPGWGRPPANSGLDPWRHRPLMHAPDEACTRLVMPMRL